MENGVPSQTALATARARADHQVLDRAAILVDPLAERLIGDVPQSMSAGDRPRRLFFAARARFAEDCVATAHDAGVRQVVMLGAGLDTFGYRHSHRDLQTFEVDHPATQAWKRRRLMDAGIDVPAAVTFVPVDFETDSLATALQESGFRRTEPAVFVWLGVVFYLTPDAALATLEYMAGQPHPTEVDFDYLQPAVTDESRAELQARADRLASAGEAWHSYFTPDDMARQLRALGFTHIEDHSAAELVDGYSGGSTRFVNDNPEQLRASRIVRAQL